MSDAPPPGSGPCFRLLTDDRPPRALQDLDDTELDTLRTAIERTLVGLPAGRDPARRGGQDARFACEWWPPE
jgi:hypothetical protein